MTSPILSVYWNDAEGQGRGYKRPSTGEQVPGVTSITGLVNKNLAQWGSDKAVEWMTANWFLWNPGGKSDEKAFNHARYKWRDFRDERGAVGDGVHNHIEDYILGRNPDPEFLDAEQQHIIRNFEEFEFFTGVEYVSTETTVWGDKFAGTLDALAYMHSPRLGRKVLSVLDWKTSRKAWPDMYMQISALMNADLRFVQVAEGEGDKFTRKRPDGTINTTYWREELMPEVESGFIVHLTQDGWAVHEITDTDLHYDRFLAYRDAWWSEKALKLKGWKLDKALAAD